MKDSDNSKWYLFLISIGFLLIAASPMFEKPLYNVLIGSIIIVVSFLFMRKYKNNNYHEYKIEEKYYER